MSHFHSNTLLGSSGNQSYEIERSLRFNDDDTAYLSRTPSSAGNRTTWTWSGWVKRSNLGANQGLFSAGTSTSDFEYIRFDPDDTIRYTFYISGSVQSYQQTDAKFRDVSAWYHVLVYRSGTTAKIYINGVEQSLSNNTTSSSNGFFNATNDHNLGRREDSASQYFDGYMTEVNFIDGAALTPSNFGKTDTETGAWIPKKYSGSYGTNGFYLNFSDNSSVSALGTDTSGNGNNFTPNNFNVGSGLTNDSVIDTPTNNFCIINRLNSSSSSLVWYETGLQAQIAGGSSRLVGSIFPSSGKYYWEVSATNNSSARPLAIGVRTPSTTGGYTEGIYYRQDGQKYIDNVISSYGSSYTTETIGVALDMDNYEVTFYKANVSQGAISLNDTSKPWGFLVSTYGSSGVTPFINCGSVGFDYTPPTGFKALNTANLPVPTIKDGSDYFNTVLYTGNSSTQSITGVGFQPDLVWIKQRNAAENHFLTDVIRGAGIHLRSDSTVPENDDSATFTAFTSDGFSLTGSGPAMPQINDNTDTYVAWNWLAGGSSSSNTDGTITSTVSANPSAGFSIVTYTGNAAGSLTVGHGLGVAPKMVIVKNRDQTGDFVVYHSSITNSQNGGIFLNLTNAWGINSTYFNNTAPTSSVFSVGSYFTGNNIKYVAYCFAEVEGYSKFGSYTGNGSADGPFVSCGFRPSLILLKSSTAAESWEIMDNKRDVYNGNTGELRPNLPNAETSSNQIDFLSNGFKIRTLAGQWNTSSQTYIFMALAENPFKYANAR